MNPLTFLIRQLINQLVNYLVFGKLSVAYCLQLFKCLKIQSISFSTLPQGSEAGI